MGESIRKCWLARLFNCRATRFLLVLMSQFKFRFRLWATHTHTDTERTADVRLRANRCSLAEGAMATPCPQSNKKNKTKETEWVFLSVTLSTQLAAALKFWLLSGLHWCKRPWNFNLNTNIWTNFVIFWNISIYFN